MTGSCHCGAVHVTLNKAPDYVNLCNCTLCSKSGGAWGYFAPDEVKVTGTTKAYRRCDYESPAVEIQFCPECGNTTHWTTTENIDEDRMGVNMRLFEPAEVKGIEVRTLDGRNWTGHTAAAHLRPVGRLGEDVFL